MEEDIKTLILFWEKEEKKLYKSLKQFVSEGEYLNAHNCQHALGKINLKLQTLRNLEDKKHDEKNFVQSMIERIKNELAKDGLPQSDPFIFEYYSAELHDLEKELALLQESSDRNTPAKGGNVFAEAFHSLVQKEISGFDLVISKSQKFLFKFRSSKKEVKVTLPLYKLNERRNYLRDKDIHSLQILGFTKAENQNKLFLTLAGTEKAMLATMNIILSKVAFELFYFKEFENDSFIVIHEKAAK